MGAELPNRGGVRTGAVFLSYASQDAEAAQRICEALRSAGVEVWFDQSELRGGDAWDHKIRQQIHDCALFIPVISAHSDARHEGYFRREWRLAVERAGDMSERIAFLVPVVIDGTSDSRADVPDRFRAVQWTRLPNGETQPAFVDRIQRLLSPEPSGTTRAPAGGVQVPVRAGWSSKPGLLVAVAVVVLGAVAYFAVQRLWSAKRSASAPTVVASAAPQAFNPPPHSIAVLPFVNMSGDKEQEYFSDGLTEELLNSLSRIKALQVAARTSSFSFAGEHPDISTVAHKLNVGAVLEGSVRRSGHTVRVTTQLINAVTGFHLWSETYDRDLGDVLKLQTEIATAVANTLKVALLGDEAAKIEAGGTHNPAALDAYLRATKTLFFELTNQKNVETALAGYTEAIRLDPDYALAYAGRSIAFSVNATALDTTTAAIRADLDKVQADAAKAIALAPDLGDGYLARANAHQLLLEFKEASQDYERALALAPGNARVLRDYGDFAIDMGHSDSGLAAIRRAVALDPLNPNSHDFLGSALLRVRRYPEALAATKEASALFSTSPGYYFGAIGSIYYLLGDFASARATCEQNDGNDAASPPCLALAYDKLGRHADAEAELKKFQAATGDAGAYSYAAIYAQWGNRPKALEWLDSAMRARDAGLVSLKTDPLMDPLRKEPRFQAMMRELRFPD